MFIQVGQTIRIEAANDSEIKEYMRVVSVDDNNSTLTAVRGIDETSIIAHADNSKAVSYTHLTLPTRDLV